MEIGLKYQRAKKIRLSLTVIFIVRLSIAIAGSTTGVQPRVPESRVIINPGNYEQAVRTCNGFHGDNWGLPAPNKDTSLDVMTNYLASLMESNKLNSVWIRLQRKDFTEWRNLDNTTFEGRVQTNGNPQKTCVLMKLHYEALVSDTCQTHGYGYACQLNACSRCPSSISPANCFVKNGKCYFVGCDVATWFNAVNLCKTMEGELATFNTAHQLQEFIAGIKSRRENVCKHYWVGLRKTDWYFSGAEGDHLPEVYQWYSDNPRSEDGCAVLKKYTSGYYWRSVNCTETHATICLKAESLVQETQNGLKSEDEKTAAKITTDKTTGSENDGTTARIASGKTAEKFIKAENYCEGGVYRRLDFIVAMWSIILITVLVYASCLIMQCKSKVTEFATCLSFSRKDTSGRIKDAGGDHSWERRELMERKSTPAANGLDPSFVLNPPASTSELKVPSPYEVGGSTQSDTNVVHSENSAYKICTI